jgi:predicted RNase H-like HicB family nuclease
MEYRAVIQQTGGWWIGWVIDLPGVNAQERTRERLLESLRIGAEDLLSLPPDLPEGATIERIVV